MRPPDRGAGSAALWAVSGRAEPSATDAAEPAPG
jgi:hypothetical protein